MSTNFLSFKRNNKQFRLLYQLLIMLSELSDFLKHFSIHTILYPVFIITTPLLIFNIHFKLLGWREYNEIT
jgi:hypothetical protein